MGDVPITDFKDDASQLLKGKKTKIAIQFSHKENQNY
jgi:hypothetical protein